MGNLKITILIEDLVEIFIKVYDASFEIFYNKKLRPVNIQKKAGNYFFKEIFVFIT